MGLVLSCMDWLQEASPEYVESLLGLSSATLGLIAADPSGSRVIEAFLEGPADSKKKKKLLSKLSDNFADIAATASGNFLVEKIYANGVILSFCCNLAGWCFLMKWKAIPATRQQNLVSIL